MLGPDGKPTFDLKFYAVETNVGNSAPPRSTQPLRRGTTHRGQAPDMGHLYDPAAASR